MYLSILLKQLDSVRYRIVMVGTDAETERILPSEIITISRTDNQQQLAEIYTAADVFLNPTREDTFPTVNIEALACGTPVITSDVGGSPEIPDDTSGITVLVDKFDTFADVLTGGALSEKTTENCLARAAVFDKNQRIAELICLYRQ